MPLKDYHALWGFNLEPSVLKGGIMIVCVVGSFFVLGEVEFMTCEVRIARDHLNSSVSKNIATGCPKQFLKMNVQEHLAFGTYLFHLLCMTLTQETGGHHEACP